MTLFSRFSKEAGRSKSDQLPPSDPRQVAVQLVRRINPGPTWSVDEFVASEARRRRRPITVIESRDLISLTAGVTGQLWTRELADEIVLPPGLTANERRYAIAHEMGHLLLEHPQQASPDAWVSWFDALPPHLVRKRAARFTCQVHSVAKLAPTATALGTIEQEAEWFASLLLAEVDDKRDRIAARRGADKTAQMLDRLARTFGYY